MQVQAFYYESLDPTWSDWSLHLRDALKKKKKTAEWSFNYANSSALRRQSKQVSEWK